jgi:hypothetical protein
VQARKGSKKKRSARVTGWLRFYSVLSTEHQKQSLRFEKNRLDQSMLSFYKLLVKH